MGLEMKKIFVWGEGHKKPIHRGDWTVRRFMRWLDKKEVLVFLRGGGGDTPMHTMIKKINLGKGRKSTKKINIEKVA